jgi:4a-hydroxytetrahydrobiopterin dehydratase
MKLRVTFKTPDTLTEAVNETVDYAGLKNEEEKHHLTMQLMELASDYIMYGEQVTLEFDTETSAVTVKQCRKCLKQDDYAIQAWLDEHAGWDLSSDGLVKQFKFTDFNAAMAFANRIGMWAERNDHHPLMEITWGRVKVSWRTYDAGGITSHDFAGANVTDKFYGGQS